jgi:hypothetical protein
MGARGEVRLGNLSALFHDGSKTCETLRDSLSIRWVPTETWLSALDGERLLPLHRIGDGIDAVSWTGNSWIPADTVDEFEPELRTICSEARRQEPAHTKRQFVFEGMLAPRTAI